MLEVIPSMFTCSPVFRLMLYLVFQACVCESIVILYKSFCGGDNSCISQLIAIYSPQASRSEPQTPCTLFHSLAWPYSIELICVLKLCTQKFNYDMFIFTSGVIL